MEHPEEVMDTCQPDRMEDPIRPAVEEPSTRAGRNVRTRRPEGVADTCQPDRMEDPIRPTVEEQSTRAGRNVRTRRRMNHRLVVESESGSSSSEDRGDLCVDGRGGLERQATAGRGGEPMSPQEVLRTRFYKNYHKIAKEYDKEFVKRHCEELNVTAISALFLSVVISVFIVQLHSEYLQNPWCRKLFELQVVLFTSLTLSLLAAFLALFDSHWLTRYAAVDSQGSIIERSLNRQRKLDGVANWYFDHMMGLPTLMLHTALLLLGISLSGYFSMAESTVAQVIFGVASFGVVFYLFIVVAGAVSMSCPYQTPGAYILRRIFQIPGRLHSAYSTCVQRSACCHLLSMAWDDLKENYFRGDTPPRFKNDHVIAPLSSTFPLPDYILMDAYRFLQVMARPFTPFAQGVYLLSQQGLEQESAALNLRCISWTLRTSSHTPPRLLALNYLAGIALVHFDPSLFEDCLDVLIGCINITNGKLTVARGAEQLATLSALCCLRILSHLTVVDPRVEDLRQRFASVFPPDANFDGLPFSHSLGAVHNIFYQPCKSRVVFPTRIDRISRLTWRSQQLQRIQWKDYTPPIDEQIVVAHALSKLTLFEHRRRGKVPRWLLRFAFHSLSQDPLPPASVIVNCLSIIAVDLGCHIKNPTISNESVQLDEVSHLISQKLEIIIKPNNTQFHEGKAISALLPYAAHPGQHARNFTFDKLLRAMRASRWTMWDRVVPGFFNAARPPAIVLASPHVDWFDQPSLNREDLVTRWVAAASAVTYSEEVAWSVVDVLSHTAYFPSLRSLIPIGVWAWLKKRPSLPQNSPRRSMGMMNDDTARCVWRLGDFEILKSYLLVVWSEWDPPTPLNFYETCISIVRTDFRGRRMGNHRGDLVNRLDHILEQLDRGLNHLRKQKPRYTESDFREAKEKYGGLRRVVMEMDREAL